MPTINDRIGSQNVIRVLANASAPPTRLNNLTDVDSAREATNGLILIWSPTGGTAGDGGYLLGNDIAAGLNISGITTINKFESNAAIFTGVTTSGTLSANTAVAMGSTTVITAARQLQNIASLDETTTATIETAISNAPNTFTNLKPELVEKKDPPIITNNKNIKDKFGEILLKEIPIFETLLDIETSIFKKLLSLFKKTKAKEMTNIRYINK